MLGNDYLYVVSLLIWVDRYHDFGAYRILDLQLFWMTNLIKILTFELELCIKLQYWTENVIEASCLEFERTLFLGTVGREVGGTIQSHRVVLLEGALGQYDVYGLTVGPLAQC